MKTEFDSDEFVQWLSGLGSKFAAVLAARAALRVLPMLAPGADEPWAEIADGRYAAVLTTFRACSTTLAAGLTQSQPMAGAAFAAGRDGYIVGAHSEPAYAALYAAFSVGQFSEYFDDYRRQVGEAPDNSNPEFDPHLNFDHWSIVSAEIAAAQAVRTSISVSYDCLTAFTTDRNLVDSGADVDDLAASALWAGGIPDDISNAWVELLRLLEARGQHWGNWIRWYADRLDGNPLDHELEHARALIPDGLWKLGPGQVNPAIDRLEASFVDGGPDAGKPLLEELRREYANIWLCQYRRSEAAELESRMLPDMLEEWPITPMSRDELAMQMSDGDIVLLWRTVDREKPQDGERSRGGIVGWGIIINEFGTLHREHIMIGISHAFPETPVSRDQVLEALNQPGSNWPGQVSLKLLDEVEAEIIRQFLPAAAQIDDLADTRETDFEETHETELSTDTAETTRDMLGRAPLAFALAHHINRIWSEQMLGEKTGKGQASENAAFVLHIDAPWGGGKTTFANFIARILNPSGFDLDPDKLRQDDTSLFANLPLQDREYWPEKFADRDWITVNFNAWQNQHVTPPWWNIYETIRCQCLTGLPFHERCWNIAGEWMWRLFSPATKRALATTALIILTAFLVYWSGLYAWLEKSRIANVPLSTVATVFASTGIGVLLFGSIRSGLSNFVHSITQSIDTAQLGEADPLGLFREHFVRSVHNLYRPVLVIVDDLDRCDPKYVVELVRGILTIFTSPRVVFLLLGDKTWIETSFAKVHKEMADSHRDSKITFGGRFAEKAIQLSFILPEPNPADRDDYIDRLLLGADAGTGQSAPMPEPPDENQSGHAEIGDQNTTPAPPIDPAKSVDEFEQTTIAKIRSTSSGQQRDAVLQAVRDTAKSEFGEGTVLHRAAEQIVNREATLRTASSERTETEIRHGISQLGKELPDNPRRIKRIINMIAAYQASAQATMGIDPGTDRWRQLVLWIILMSERPGGWQILNARPDLADKVIKGEKPTVDNTDSTQEHPDAGKFATLNLTAVASLIKGEAFGNGSVKLDTEAVEWLRRLTPMS